MNPQLTSFGSPSSATLFGSATWRGPRPIEEFRAETYVYPGTRPIGSFLIRGESVYGVEPALSGWRERESGGAVSLTGRTLVLAYGSNVDTVKLHDKLHTDDDIVALRCVVFGYAAVWCNGRRSEGDCVVATIVEDPGRVEVHHVIAVTPAQLIEMDRWENHPSTYERQPFGGTVVLENGTVPDGVAVYVGRSEGRQALVVDGDYWRVAEHPHAEVDSLVAHS